MKHIFRSWNEHYKMFVYFKHGCYFKDIGGKYPILSNIDVRAEFWSNEEQSTGLKDKNNKEIFEGDTHTWSDKKGVVRYSVNDAMWSVDYTEGKRCGQIAYRLQYHVALWGVVVGNIHQNKEILEDMKSD